MITGSGGFRTCRRRPQPVAAFKANSSGESQDHVFVVQTIQGVCTQLPIVSELHGHVEVEDGLAGAGLKKGFDDERLNHHGDARTNA